MKSIVQSICKSGIIVVIFTTFLSSGLAADEDPVYRLALGLSAASGNSDTFGLTGGLVCENKSSINEFKLGLEGKYDEANNEVSESNAKLYFEYKRLFEHFHIFSDDSIFHDDDADIRYRLILSAGPGKYLVRNDVHRLSVELGAAFIRQVDTGTGNADNGWGLMPKQEYEWKLSSRARLWEKASLVAYMDEWGRYLVETEAGLENSLTDRVNLKVKISDTYDSEPVNDKERNDFSIDTGIECKF